MTEAEKRLSTSNSLQSTCHLSDFQLESAHSSEFKRYSPILGASTKEPSMKRTFLKGIVLLCAMMAIASFLPTRGQELSKRKLSNQDILDMVSLGLGDDVILEKIKSAPETDFATDLESLKALKAAKVSDPVIRAMINPKAASVAASPTAAAVTSVQPAESATSQGAAQDVSVKQTDPKFKGKLPTGTRIFISAMQGNLDGFISAEIVKRKLPVSLTTDENSADFVLTGSSIKADDRWYHVAFGGKDKNEGNVALLRVKDKTIVWAGEAGDRSLWWGGFKRGGERKVADRIVSKMKQDLF